jgi:hypothetical protein
VAGMRPEAGKNLLLIYFFWGGGNAFTSPFSTQTMHIK